MAASRFMEMNSSEDEHEDVIELEAIRRPYRPVKHSGAQHYHDPRYTSAVHRNNWSTSTQRVLSSMPSRSIRFHQLNAFSRSTGTRRRQPPSVVSTTHRSTEHDIFREQDEFTQKEELINKLQGLSAGECVRLLREMPLSVSEKRQIRALVFCWEAGQPLYANRSLCCRQFKTWLLKGLCGWRYGRVSWQKPIELWQGEFKTIRDHFGSGVLSYFIFLRRLLLYNILLFLINGFFLVLPQIQFHQKKNTSSDDLWMLTGTGILTDSVMFYGHYSNENCQMCPENYDIPLAYIFTIGAGMFITCVMLVYSMSKSIGKSFHVFKTSGNLALKVFCSWDFKVSKKQSVKLQSTNICTQLKEMLSELSCSKQKRNLCSTWSCLHFLIWSICIFCIAGCMLGVYYLPPMIDQISSKKAVGLLMLPLLVSCISHLLPGFFNMLSGAEHYESPSTQIYVSIVRNLLLKGCIFGVLCYHWLEQLCCRRNGLNTHQCWETLVGQEVYRLVIMDLLFAISYIILVEFVWGLCSRNMTFRRRKLEFDISEDVLELIYGQTLVWFGVLFSPLLPAVQIGKLFLLFYFKKTSLMRNFQLPQKPWRTTQMSTLFIKLLFFPSFTGALACVIYTMWRVRPSSDCGPFRNLHSMFLLNLVDNPLFLFIASGLFLTVIYIHMQVLDGQKMIIVRLQKQIDNEGEDKKFLIAKLQALNEASATSPHPQ